MGESFLSVFPSVAAVDPVLVGGATAVVALVLLRWARSLGDRLPVSSDGPLLLAAAGPLWVVVLILLAITMGLVPLLALPLLVVHVAILGPLAFIFCAMAPFLPPYPWPAVRGSKLRGPFLHWFARVVAVLAMPFLLQDVLDAIVAFISR